MKGLLNIVSSYCTSAYNSRSSSYVDGETGRFGSGVARWRRDSLSRAGAGRRLGLGTIQATQVERTGDEASDEEGGEEPQQPALAR